MKLDFLCKIAECIQFIAYSFARGSTVYLISLLGGELFVLLHLCTFFLVVKVALIVTQLTTLIHLQKLHFRLESAQQKKPVSPRAFFVTLTSMLIKHG